MAYDRFPISAFLENAALFMDIRSGSSPGLHFRAPKDILHESQAPLPIFFATAAIKRIRIQYVFPEQRDFDSIAATEASLVHGLSVSFTMSHLCPLRPTACLGITRALKHWSRTETDGFWSIPPLSLVL